MAFWIQVIKVATALFIITDSFGNLPFYIALTEGVPPPERRRITLTAILTGLIMMAFFVFAGSLVLDLFDLTLDDLRVAGGVLLLIISIEVLMRGKVAAEHREDIGVVPLGSPLLVGPGAITTVLVMTKLYQLPAVVLGVLICFTLIWLVFHFAEIVFKVIGRNGSLIVTKIAAILIAAIAVRFIRVGIQAFFKII
ncbi:MAG: MarC family protein [Candidatus Margulisbacteria bacterium]|nr:MarC family protein [Candidatus Margulisiibacteriota bacterium]